MVTIELEKIVKERKPNAQQDRYSASLKRFKTLVEKGVVEERKNQLLVDTSKVKYNIY